MECFSAENASGALKVDSLFEIVEMTLNQFPELKKVLIVHPDYSRHDFTDTLVPHIYKLLQSKGLVQLDTLNAAGTHRPMAEEEFSAKLGISKASHPLIGTMNNHEFDNPDQLFHVGDIDADYVKGKTAGHLEEPLSVTANKLLKDNYDLIIALNGTVPHEGTGFSGGTKIFFPGVSGPEVTAMFHWAAVLIGIPTIIGKLENAARDVVNLGTKMIFDSLTDTPIVSFNMVYSEDQDHNVVARGLFSGVGTDGFATALNQAADLSSRIHIVYLDEAKKQIVQRLPEMYDEIWTAGKGSYKLQRPGVVAEGGEVILFAPHIDCFHSNPTMDKALLQIGYHGRDYVVDYCQKNPDFDKNVASHVINVRGIGKMVAGKEIFPFKVTLATAIPEDVCKSVGLGYRNPATLKEEDFQGPGQLWISEGGQWLYDRS